ncbi:hypothetical protein [Botrimarina hoheduenensis]|uniref:Uncharacterized protein n=1 Tax=Botrimarina hoheduenensis TaxID=2528000 RepID=A0A5C5VTI6_9BACT|nr:hypothetical protein [Botrimarina hoheduenensis]TWT41433.1 hypothetical protein Pla111_31480 [Botrimarina hoheduenensis]
MPSRSLTTEAARQHVAKCLRINPIWEAETVISTRAKTLGFALGEQAESGAALKRIERRAEVRQQLFKIRDQVWVAPLEHLGKQLEGLNFYGDTEIEGLAERLRVIVRNRPALPQLTAEKHFDSEFFSCFREVLTALPREAAELRQRVSASFSGHRGLRRTGKRMIRLLEEKTPELAALEKDWLTRLKFQRGVWFRWKKTASSESGQGGIRWYWWWLALIVLRILFRLGNSGD